MTVSARKIAAFAKLVAGLADVPNLASSTLLKQWFDSSPEELRVAVNGLIDDLISTAAGASGTEQIGSAAISGVAGLTAYAQLVDLKNQLTSAVMGSLNDETKSALTQKIGLVNGNSDVWQRGTSFTNPVLNTYMQDRWRIGVNNPDGGTFPNRTISRQSLTPGELLGSYYFSRTATDGASAALGVNAAYAHEQLIEFGTRYLCGSGKKITVSFWARSSIAGKKIGVSIYQSYGTGGSPSGTEQLNGGNFTLSTTWTKYTFTFLTNTLVGKVFGTNNDDNLIVRFLTAWGSTAAGSVGATGTEGFSAAVNIDMTQVQINSGDIALPFQPRSFADELVLCQRYYEKSFDYSVTPANATNTDGYRFHGIRKLANNTFIGKVLFKVSKRITSPTITFKSFSTGGDGTTEKWGGIIYAVVTEQVNDKGFSIISTQDTVANDLFYGHWVCDAEL